jgi:alkylation response protein AidB-like acyl-CoA dehydrogenase
VSWNLDASQREILDAADKFARRELYPLANRMDAEEWWPPDVMPKIAAAGFLGITTPADLGGNDLDLFSSETMRTFTYRVLAACNDLDKESGGRGEIHALTAASVLYAAETMNEILDDAVQVHGGSGYIWESEINRLFRATKLLEIGAGTSEVRKLIISEELLSR